jgi:hypothetical protein
MLHLECLPPDAARLAPELRHKLTPIDWPAIRHFFEHRAHLHTNALITAAEAGGSR